MENVLLRATLLDRGYTADDLERMRRSGELTRLRRGAYTWRAERDLSPEDRHRQLIAGTVPQLRSSATVSHVSAAVLHGLPVWPEALDRVHLTRPRVGGGKARTLLRIHSSDLASDDVLLLDGIPVTSLARTVGDLGRHLPLDQAVAAGDRALRDGLRPEELETVLDRSRGWPGSARALLMARLLDRRSESAGESVSRIRMHEAGLPAPEPQLSVYDERGRLVGRADFGWRDQKVLGEFDGRVKYGRLLKPGQSIEEVVYREKLREDALRDLGWRVVRWTWADLYPGDELVSRLRRALR
jgi:hypothetical protein